MKIGHLLIVLICWSSCKNYGGEKTTEKEIASEEDKKELGDLLSSEEVTNQDTFGSASVANMKTEGSELTSYELSKQGCEKCDGEKVLAVSQTIDDLNYQLIYDLLCTFDQSCSRNVEYTEFSNDVLYKVLSKHPKAIVELLSGNPELNSEYIYEQISSPLLDYDYNDIINSVKEIEGDEGIKKRILGSVEKALEG